jgi:hypothetical protein
VNESAPGPGDIKIYNAEAHMNYDGFRFDGAATAITMVNDKAYANRDSALVDNTGAVTYSYCHFYASSLAVAGSTDVLAATGPGPTAGAGNIAVDTPAGGARRGRRYPAENTLTVDDSGMTVGADTYYAGTVLPIADAAGSSGGSGDHGGISAGADAGVRRFQGWINAGRDVTSHSISHTYYTNTDALDIQYTEVRDSGLVEHQWQGADDYGDRSFGQRELQPGAGGCAGNDWKFEHRAYGHGEIYDFGLDALPGALWDGMFGLYGGALLSQDLADVSGHRCEEFGVSHAVGCDAADYG